MDFGYQAALFDPPPGTAGRPRCDRDSCARTVQAKPARPATLQDDLFLPADGVRFSTRFFSGCTAANDAAGIMAAGLPLGMAATEMKSAPIFDRVRQHLRNGHRVFLDSGVFGNFMARARAEAAGKPLPPEVSFADVLDTYDRVAGELGPGDAPRLSLVMPDAIGDQGETLRLVRRYRERILGYIARGIDVILPVQRGALPAQQALRATALALGSEDFRAGVPSKAKAMSLAEVATLRHPRLHLLGRAAESRETRIRAFALLEHNPDADLSCDANLLRPEYTQISAAQADRRALLGNSIAFAEVLDDTELAAAVLGEAGWMSRDEVAAVAGLFARFRGPQPVAQWLRAHKSGPLAEFLGTRHGAEAVETLSDHLYRFGLPAIFARRAEATLSAQARIAEFRERGLGVAARFRD